MDALEQECLAERVVRDYSDMVLRIGYTWFNNLYDAQDICQTVLMKRMRREEGFGTTEGERRWMVRVAVNACKSLRRSAWLRRTVALEEGAALCAPEPEEDAVLEQVKRLPRHYREVVYLHYYEGYQVKEIAALLGRSPALVSTHLARARAKLKDMLGGNEDG